MPVKSLSSSGATTGFTPAEVARIECKRREQQFLELVEETKARAPRTTAHGVYALDLGANQSLLA